MINLLCITGSKSEAHQFVLIARELIKADIKMHLATSRPMVYDYVKIEMGWSDISFFEIKKIKKIQSIDNKLLEKYTKPTIAEIISSEQIITHWKQQYKFNLLLNFIKKFETLIAEKNIDILMKYPTCSLIGRTAFSVMSANNKKTLIINTGPIITETFTLNDIDEGWLWSEFFESYNNNLEISSDIRSKVSIIVDSVIKDKRKSIVIKKLNIKSTLYHIILYLYQKIRFINDPIQFNEMKKEINLAIGKLQIAPNYSQLNKAKKYVFFPFHIPWDAQIATRNPMFHSQENIAELISRSLPPNYTLYVKEHPYYCGGVNKKMLSKIKKLENVEILDPSISSLDVIESAKAIITINSTAGWESIIMKKPLIVLGNPYYAYFKQTYKVENINLLPNILNTALHVGNKNYETNLDDWYKFIYSSVSSSNTGSMSLYKNYMGLGKKIDENRIMKLSSEIEKKIRKTLN